MPFAITADWDSQNRVSRYNYVEAEAQAIAIVNKLHGIGENALPLAKQSPNAYYVLMPPAPAGTGLFQHRARFWKADPVNKTVSFDTVACHVWQSKVSNRQIDYEADGRIDKVFSPDNPSRADRARNETPDGSEKSVLITRVTVIRTAAQTLKDSFITKTPEELLAVKPNDDIHWQ